jgi:hypothetical protein
VTDAMADTAPDIKVIFVEALDLANDAERVAYLERACAGSSGVRARVDALLGAIGQAGTCLEAPALAQEVSREPGAGVVSTTIGAEADWGDAPADIWAPTRLGDLELVRRAG